MNPAARWTSTVGFVAIIAFFLGGSNAFFAQAEGEAVRPVTSINELARPDKEKDFPLVRAIERRRSVRQFKPDHLSDEQVGSLLWAAQGITSGERSLRASPSAGATYPLELFVVDSNGVHRYFPEREASETFSHQDVRRDLSRAALSQEAILQAPASIVIAADYERTTGRYGQRGIRYVHIETGHAAQNIHLKAVAMGLASVPIGAFDDDEVTTVLGLPENLSPLYIIPVGLADH